jgi:ABC-type transport system involved in cytochrome bd biosynthesis fused ATPase/permease subunit
MLARTLYTEADIFLLDDPFKGIPFETAHRILKNIRIYFNDQTFIINTQYPNCPSFDKTIIFDNGRIL